MTFVSIYGIWRLLIRLVSVHYFIGEIFWRESGSPSVVFSLKSMTYEPFLSYHVSVLGCVFSWNFAPHYSCCVIPTCFLFTISIKMAYVYFSLSCSCSLLIISASFTQSIDPCHMLLFIIVHLHTCPNHYAFFFFLICQDILISWVWHWQKYCTGIIRYLHCDVNPLLNLSFTRLVHFTWDNCLRNLC